MSNLPPVAGIINPEDNPRLAYVMLAAAYRRLEQENKALRRALNDVSVGLMALTIPQPGRRIADINNEVTKLMSVIRDVNNQLEEVTHDPATQG